tara:strand:- start:135 stop:602 length:468 start_codon:yes stop_codon:yes gene_type:complete
MESTNSSSGEPQATVETAPSNSEDLSDQWFGERFETLLPRIQETWPDLAKQTIEASRGSFDELVRVISEHTGKTDYGVQEQLEEIFNNATDKTKEIAESLEPLEKQLEELLDELNSTLRPKIEKPVRERPILALGIATGIGLILGLLLSGNGRRN